MKIRGVRGAITVKSDSAEAILSAAQEVLEEMITLNEIEEEDVASVIFTVTPDLTALIRPGPPAISAGGRSRLWDARRCRCLVACRAVFGC